MVVLVFSSVAVHSARVERVEGLVRDPFLCNVALGFFMFYLIN